MMKQKYYWCILFISFCNLVRAQDILEKIKFLRIDISHGLSNSNVTATLQDSQGFLWVGTEDGLNKYDGYAFKIYRHNKADTCSLVKNIVNDLYEDSRGILWVCTRGGGVHYYDRPHDRFIRIKDFSDDCDIVEITEDHDKNLWIGGTRLQQAFAARLDAVTGKWKHYDLFPSDHPVASILQKRKNEYYVVVGSKGFYLWNVLNNALQECLPHESGSEGIVSNDVIKAIEDVDGIIWLATRKGLSRFDIRTNTFKNFTSVSGSDNPFPINIIRDICLDGSNLWIATENGGLSRLDTKTNRFTNFLFNKDDPASLSDNSVWSVYRDHQGRIWVGTFSKGLCVIDPLKEKFSELNIPLENDVVNAICRDWKDRIWIGTEGGIVRKDGRNIRYFRHEPGKKNSLSNNPVLSVFEDGKRQLWFGTWDGGINKYDERNENFVHYLPDPNDPESLSNPNVYSIKENSLTHELLVSTYQGLNILVNEKAGKFRRYIDTEHEANNYLRTIFEDREHSLWTGSIGELNLFDTQSKQRRRVYLNAESKQQDAFINCLLEDKKGRLWVGTNNALHLLIDKKYISSYTVDDGLPNDIVRSMLEDDHGNLWLGTAQGLSRFDPEAKTFTNYTVSDGLISNEFKPNACFKDRHGQFFFGGKGVIVFHPENVKSNPYPPPVYLNDLKLFNESVKIGGSDHVLSASIQETKEITLDHRYSFFTLDYVALNFTASDKNRYAYKLEGFHKEWNFVGSQRSATFTNLDPGTYTFHVKASNNDGLWNETGASLVIHVLPPWWNTWWFRIVSGLALIMLAVAYYNIRVHTIKIQNRRLEVMVEGRTRELQESNEELRAREDKIQAQNRELLLREEEIRAQNEELVMQREELATQNEELQQSEEEISSQRDLVSEQNRELEKARQIIEEQNSKIVLRNEMLEMEVKERTKELVEYNQQLEQFAFISAHNLRAPVARILGLGQIFSYAKENPEEQKLIIEKMVYTTTELDRVVKDLNTILDLRKDNDTLITGIDLEEELKLVKINMEKEIEDTRTQITYDLQVKIIHTVKPYLDSILINLISNAIKYRHPDRFPVIHIKSEAAGEYVRLSVADNGLGIDLSLFKDKLFTLYSRFHTHLEGKGMGLYLVKTQVLALGGKIEVESKVNSGMVFKVYLKIKPDHSIL